MNNILKYTPSDFCDDIRSFKLQVGYRPDHIIGISRGGLIPAVALSHLLEVPMTPLTWQTRDGDIKQMIDIPKGSLIVDDINDTGKTLTEVTSQIDHMDYRTYCLFDKPLSEFSIDYCARRMHNQNLWIEFFWESIS